MPHRLQESGAGHPGATPTVPGGGLRANMEALAAPIFSPTAGAELFVAAVERSPAARARRRI